MHHLAVGNGGEQRQDDAKMEGKYEAHRWRLASGEQNEAADHSHDIRRPLNPARHLRPLATTSAATDDNADFRAVTQCRVTALYIDKLASLWH